MSRRLLRASRWFHKYVGLALILYAMLMGFSGIFVNHPDWIDEWSVPGWMVPPQYHPEDFDRGALSQYVYSARDPQRGWIGGTEGVWTTRDGGRSFEPFDAGFPTAPYRRLTHALLLDEGSGDRSRLFAGAECGLFVAELGGDRRVEWQPLSLGENEQPVRALLQVGDDLIVCTKSEILRGSLRAPTLQLQRVDCSRAVPADSPAREVSLVWLLFDTHSGALLGLPGRLLIDVTGLVIVFLGLSAFWIWYYPFRRRRVGKATGRDLFRQLFRYHLKLGIWLGVIVLLLSITGLFMRPPLLILPGEAKLDVDYYPHQAAAESWRDRIHRAVHDAGNGRILIESSEGFWSAPEDLSAPFEPHDTGVPVHVMGSSTLVSTPEGVVVGSFSGAFRRTADAVAFDVVADAPAGEVSRFRSAEVMVTGYFTTPASERFISTFHNGIRPLAGTDRDGRFAMPDAMRERFRMPLWNWMFELHNGRFFRDWIGGLYFVVPILGSLLMLALSLTGIYDWLATRRRRVTEAS